MKKMKSYTMRFYRYSTDNIEITKWFDNKEEAEATAEKCNNEEKARGHKKGFYFVEEEVVY